MCVYGNCRNEFLVIINGYVEFNPTVRGLISRVNIDTLGGSSIEVCVPWTRPQFISKSSPFVLVTFHFKLLMSASVSQLEFGQYSQSHRVCVSDWRGK